MPIYDPIAVYDGWGNLALGVDGGRPPDLIEKNQCFEADNAIFRGGYPTQRMPLLDVGLTFDNPDTAYSFTGQFIGGPVPNNSVFNFHNANFQGADYFGVDEGREFIIVMIGGRLYQITPSTVQTAHVREIQLAWRNNALIPQTYMVQAGIYFVIQDGQGAPIIFDGVSARRAVPPDEIFTGLFMACGQGRIVLVGVDGLVYFGDIRDGMGGGDGDMLKFTETKFLNEGFPSFIPPECGKPTAIAFLPQQDAATGMGDCIIFGSRGAEGFTLSIARDQWKNSQFQRPVLRGIGCVGPWAVAQSNNDLLIRAFDGYRTYRQARAEAYKLSQIPLSTNVRKFISADTRGLLRYASVIEFDNRVLGTCTPVPNAGKFYHNGIVSMDFDVLSTFGGASQPAWDGHWGNWDNNPLVGIRVQKLVEGMFAGEQRTFAFVLKEDGTNSFVELMRKPVGHDSGGPIRMRLLSRALDFEQATNEKSLHGGDYWIDQVTESTTVTTSYSPDQSPKLNAFGLPFTLAPLVDTIADGSTIEEEGFSPRNSISKPDNSADTQATQRINRRFYDCSINIDIVGRARLRKFRAQALALVERTVAK